MSIFLINVCTVFCINVLECLNILCQRQPRSLGVWNQILEEMKRRYLVFGLFAVSKWQTLSAGSKWSVYHFTPTFAKKGSNIAELHLGANTLQKGTAYTTVMIFRWLHTRWYLDSNNLQFGCNKPIRIYWIGTCDQLN